MKFTKCSDAMPCDDTVFYLVRTKPEKDTFPFVVCILRKHRVTNTYMFWHKDRFVSSKLLDSWIAIDEKNLEPYLPS